MNPDRRVVLGLFAAVVVFALALDLHIWPAEVGIDFHTYEAAGMVGIEHGWSHLYDQGLVKLAQERVVPSQRTQPFLSPPPVAWIAAPLLLLPYGLALAAWAATMLAALVFALASSTFYTGWLRVLAVATAVVPWWVLQAVGVGQVVPLVAVGVLVAWRLHRGQHEVAAGIALALILLKPNTAIFVPLALLVAGRLRTFIAWMAAAVAVVAASIATLGPSGVTAYVSSLGHLPSGADTLTLYGSLGVTGVAAIGLRLAIAGAALLTAVRLRASPGLVIALGLLASLITAPYLHASDLCLLVAAGWIMWSELRVLEWRAALSAIWVLATPFVFLTAGRLLNRWGLVELGLLAALAVWAWTGDHAQMVGRPPLTDRADFGSHAPA